jgi:hypothetical protein
LFYLAIFSGLHAITAIYRLVSRRLERKLSNFLAALGAIHIYIVHVSRSSASTTAGVASAVLTKSPVAIGTVNWAVSGWLERQLGDVGPAFGAG